VDLGDVVVLDEGRGQELWLARALSLVEGEADPFLVLFECDGPAGVRAIVAFDPNAREEIAILMPRDGFEGTTPLTRAPQSLELDIEGEPTHLSIERRRVASAKHENAKDADGTGDLPTKGEVQIATYRGGARARAILLRSASTQLYVGRSESLSAVSILAAS
ncbi:MAG: hypothetical protein ACXVEF_39730, partial [Polyangiales bacterium]